MFNPLSPTDWLLYSALLGTLAVGYFSWQSHERGIGEATVQAKWDKAKAQQEAAAQRRQQSKQAGKGQALQRIHDGKP